MRASTIHDSRRAAPLMAIAAGLLAAGLLGASTCAAAPPAPKPWKPDHAEYIVPAGPGAALDLAARKLVQMMQQEGLVDNMIVSNRPGGNTAIALNVLDQKQGDGNYLMTLTSSLINDQIIGSLNKKYTDYTPVANLLDENVAVVVRADSPWHTAMDLVNALKKNPGQANIAIATSIGNHIHVGIARPLKAAGVDVAKLTIVPFKSSADSMTALLGGHVNIVAATTPNLLAPLQTGKIRVLAIAAPERLNGPLASIPTWKEQGVNVVSVSSQAVIGPKGMTPEQIAFWDHAIRVVTAKPEWQEFLAHNQWRSHYLDAKGEAAYLDQQYAATRSVLADLGLARQ
ncbi:tripartite tricarboxylate transporter substrate binding protein [Achromobacter aloeverae]|uniref:Tripartite tricarboxylate transporter substrate binding protein n=1 Tax=Achromobacter aloeverae TaxID=1750518 RepID=A0A4Q1HFP2_9BURK|nr:tripartite tricarboxylate transporter substrate binding protein [Achromobacter aloeverae]RXN85388.1 tripartite tricarboxylate transporter substrate binding protein [Achromobacter aloeverae]